MITQSSTQQPAVTSNKAVKLDFNPATELGRQVRLVLKQDGLRWPEGLENVAFVKTTVSLLDVTYGKNEILVRSKNPHDSFFSKTPNGKYWTVSSLCGKSQTKGPIILDFNMKIIDGHHRLIDAAWAEQDTIEAYVRIKWVANKRNTKGS